jgi:hypothetical protein
MWQYLTHILGFVVAVQLSTCSLPAPVDVAAAQGYWGPGNTYSRPFNTWIENGPMETFVRKRMAQTWIGQPFNPKGVAGLSDDFDCSRRKSLSSCSDCFVCTRSHPPELGSDFTGMIFVLVEIGPGDTVRAMTYWKHEPTAAP